jgi:hypothetical protein
MGTSGQVLVLKKNDDIDGSNWLSQHEFVEKELTILLVLQRIFKDMQILNPKHYACQLIFLSKNLCEKISGNVHEKIQPFILAIS